MDRSGRLISASQSQSSSTQAVKKLKIFKPSHHSKFYENFSGADFEAFAKASIALGVPSVAIGHIGVDKSSGREVSVLGSGFTAQVVQHVTDDSTETILPQKTTIALKVFRSRQARDVSNQAQRQLVYDTILREIKALCRRPLSGHPNIVQVLFLGWRVDDPFPVLAMELGTHGSLAHVIQTPGPGLSVLQKRHITIDIAMGLYAIHHAGFVHGDLKPDNIIISSHPNPDRQIIGKVTDFGGSIQATGRSSGKPVHATSIWCSPEVLNQDPDVDWKKADVYSYGLVVGSIWARKDEGFGHGRLQESSSSFLSIFIPPGMEEKDIPDLMWFMKSQDMVAPALAHVLGTMGMDEVEIFEILASTLEAFFWLRPDTDGLTKNFTLLAKRLGRDMMEEKRLTIVGDDAVIASTSEHSNLFTWTSSHTYAVAIEQQIVLSLEDIDKSIDYVPITEDIPSQFSEELSPTEFLYILRDAFKRRLLGHSAGVESKALFSSWMAFSRLNPGHNPMDRAQAVEWMIQAALHGNVVAICYATLMLQGTHVESRLPVRLYLSLLALSRSNRAMQILSTRWRSLWNIVRKVILERPLAYKKSSPDFKVTDTTFLGSTLLLYFDPLYFDPLYSPDRQYTLHESLTLGAFEEVDMILHGTAPAADWDELLPGLLHELSALTDAQAALFVRTACQKGAELGYLTTPESPVSNTFKENNVFDGLPTRYSPLSSAIRRGKPMLATAIFCAHIEFEVPISDFPAALKLSFAFLYHDIGNMLLQLSYQNPTMCKNGEEIWDATETPLLDILALTQLGGPDHLMDLERRCMLDGEYDTAYAKTIQVLLAEDMNPTEGFESTCPLARALLHDDVASVRLYTRYIQDRGLDVLAHLNDPGNLLKKGIHDSDASALVLCVMYDCMRCLIFLLEEFPDLLQMNNDPPDSTSPLAQTCSRTAQTPLVAALQQVKIEAADLIASHCSNEQLSVMLGQKGENGETIFCNLLLFRDTATASRRSKLIESIRWVASHGGANFKGSDGTPCFHIIIGRVRPISRNDQIHDAELFGLLLDLHWDQIQMEHLEHRILAMASRNGHVEIVKLLIARDFDIDACTNADGLSQEFRIANGLTTLDMLSIYRAAPGMPAEIRPGSLHDLTEWHADLEEIEKLLAARTKHSKASRNERVLEYISAVERNRSRIEELLNCSSESRRVAMSRTFDWVSGPEPFAGMWPPPIPKDDNSAENLEGAPPEIQYLSNRWRMLNETTSRREELLRRNEGMLNPYWLKHLSREAREAKQTWRLPQDWDFAGFVKIKEDHGDWRALFKNRNSGIQMFQKPELHRGENVADSKSRPFQEVERRTATLRLRKAQEQGRREARPGVKADFPSLSNALDSVIEYMRNFGIQVDARFDLNRLGQYTNNEGNTLIHIAATFGITEALTHPIFTIDDINRENNDGMTALQIAVHIGKVEFARMLLDHGAQPDRLFQPKGQTTVLLPLHLSTLQRTPEMAQLLLNAGANPDGATLEGIPALHFCLYYRDNAEMVQVLIDGGADVNLLVENVTPLSIAVAMSRVASLKALLSAGAAMNATRDLEQNYSLLHIAAQKGHTEIAKMLLDHGADINRRDRSLKTPIVDAVLHSQTEMLEFLCAQGADLGVVLEFQFFRGTKEGGKIDLLVLHVGDGEQVSAETVRQRQEDTYMDFEEWKPVTTTKRDEATG